MGHRAVNARSVGGRQDMTFNQQGWQVRGDVYNVAGNLILSKDGSKGDFLRALEEVKRELADLPDVDETTRQGLTKELQQAAEEANSPAPSRENVVTRLERVRARLESLGGAAAAAMGLASTIGSIAAWAGGFF